MSHKNIKQDEEHSEGYDAEEGVTITILCRVVGDAASVKENLGNELKQLRKQSRQRYLGEGEQHIEGTAGAKS